MRSGIIMITISTVNISQNIVSIKARKNDKYEWNETSGASDGNIVRQDGSFHPVCWAHY